jgi:hypothetical protein
MRAIVHREMQVAARRKATYFFRTIAAALGLALAILIFVVQEDSLNTGRYLFWAVSIAGCVYAIREGVHRAALALSEERAQGTLGLLFLTPLKGFDVVLGKFVSVSLQAFQMALVVTPILAIAFLAGGVSIAEFGRAALCVFNFTFFFIAMCLLISSLTASEMAATTLSFIGLIAICALGFYRRGLHLRAVDLFFPIRPWFSVDDAGYGFNPLRFWISLVLSHCAGWLMLWMCSILLKRTWPMPAVFPRLAFLWTRSRPARKARRSTRVLGDSAPLEWLLLRNVYPHAPLMFVYLCIAISIFCWWLFRDPEGGIVIGAIALVLLALSVTIHSCVSMARARKSGILDSVAVAPLSNFEMVSMQITGLRRAFLAPILIAVGWMCFFIEWKPLRSAVLAGNWDSFMPLYYLASYLLMTWAAVYMGIWMALKEKGPARAFLRTAFLTLFFPWVLPIPNALYWFIIGNVARQTVRTEFRELILKRAQKPPPFPTIQ